MGFNLRSGNKSGLPFKEMGSSAVKQSEHFGPGIKPVSGQFGQGENPGGESEIMKLSRWEDEAKTKKTANEVQKVVDQTDEKIASTKAKEEKKSYEDRLASVKERDISLQEKKYADKTSTTKTSISKEQEKEMKKTAMIRDAIESATAGKSVFTRQDAHDEKMLGLDITTAEKTENQEELPNESIVEDDSYITASKGKSKTGSEMFGKI